MNQITDLKNSLNTMISPPSVEPGGDDDGGGDRHRVLRVR